ncbi:MAG: SLBB domain-containing protein, partial [Planctomycetota bacterium]
GAEETMKPATALPPSTLERLYGGRFDRSPDRRLQQFGYDYFDRPVDVDEVGPAVPDYLLGPGDEVLITVWGSFDAFHRLTVDRDGQISIPEVGAVPVAGRTYAELPRVVRSAYAQTRRDFELSVAMGRLRRIQVHVVGNVRHPGLVEIPARATVVAGLIAAGGPTKEGSLRAIQLRRPGGGDVVDLYPFLVSGDPTGSEILRAGDVVFVPPIGATVGVAGFVQRPGIYEIGPETNVDGAIELAGGLTPFTFTPQVQLERTVDGRGRETLDITLDETGRRTPMGDGELLLIGAVDDQMQPVVRISGEVVRPGAYQYRDGLTVSDLLEQADGLTIDAYLPQAFISRQVGAPGSVDLVPERQSLGSSRRVLVVDLAAALRGEAEHDIQLMPLDFVEVRSREASAVRPTVSIIGPVQAPGTYELTAGLRVSQLIAMAGNLLPEVYYDEAELIRRVYDPATRQLDVRRFRFDLGRAMDPADPTDDPVLQNQDQLVIRALRSAQVTVRIEGEVRFPGQYVFPAGARITDLIAAAGGVLDGGDLRAAVFSRESVRRLQQNRFEDLTERTRRQYEAALERMVQTGQMREGLAARLAVEQTHGLLERMSQHQATGRVVVPLQRADFPTTSFNLTLEDGDVLLIPRRLETVSVIGHVFNPTTFVAEPGMSVETLLGRAGGLTEQADDERIYVMRADGNVESLAQQRGRLSLSGPLLAGDVVLVPRRPLERTFGAQLADTVGIARDIAGIAMLLSNLNEDVDVTAVLQSYQTSGVSGYDDTILRSRK